MTLYNTPNGSKPRFDGGGTEFGRMHRDLGPGYSMFDIDRMSAAVSFDLELKRENEGFVEYRHTGDSIRFVAIMELKANRTKYSEIALDSHNSISVARAEMARRLGARLFVVFATDNHQPFDFYEIDTSTRLAAFVGTLEYTRDTRTNAVKRFWSDTLGIDRHFPPVNQGSS